VAGRYWEEDSVPTGAWDTRIGLGMKGVYLRSLYIWDYFKAPTNMHYTPRRVFDNRLIDRCTPFSVQGHPACGSCDQYQASSTCFSSCGVRTYATSYSANECDDYTCSSSMCTSCYYDSASVKNNYCTGCIENAFLIDGSLSTCVCSLGFYYSLKTQTCKACHPLCASCLKGSGPDQCLLCKPGRPRWNGVCVESCRALPPPFNATFVYAGLRENTCEACPEFHYTTNSVTCIPQAYPQSLQAFENSYLILTFSKPVKYSATALGGDVR